MSLDKGGKFELIVGLDFKTTDPMAMKFFIDLKKRYKDMRFFCYGDKGKNKNDIVFHPKINLFKNSKETISIVGSTNLTKGGLMSNFEVNTIFNEKNPVYYSQLLSIERMQYVLLHTGGEDCHLFRLKTKGHFKIWTKETLEQYGFNPEHAPYYVVLHFDNSKEIEMPKQPNLKQKINTYRAKIRPLSDFFGIN